MQTRPTKAQIRAEINRQLEEFLESGGEVQEVESGVSGRDSLNTDNPGGFVERPKANRTPVNNVISDIEDRKKANKTVSKPRKKPRKQLIYDDFGEPLRWVWVDE